MELPMIHSANRRDVNSHNSSRTKLMMSCASLALAAVAANPQPAQAQAFQGSIGSVTGSVVRTPVTGTSETITVGSSTATINWTPTDRGSGGGAIDFLPSGNTATFTSTPSVGDYTVLNRIVPVDASRPIALNGHVISTLQGTSATGGKVWFYSPGGLVIGASAVFDVGGLLLTANDVSGLSAGSGNSFSAHFASAPGSTSSVQVQKGATINAVQPGSYVAMIAPRVEQDGAVRAIGSTAYVGAEQLTMTMNGGLFDIQVDVGTSDPNGVVHSGSTGGPADSHNNIYMVAVPKNQALTMLLSGGSVGFDATEASVQNGQIILSSGYSVHGKDFVAQAAGEGEPNGPASIELSGGDFTSSVSGRASGSISADGDGGALTFARDLLLDGDQAVILTADDGESLSVAGNANLASDFGVVVAAQGGAISADSLIARTDGGNFGGYVVLLASGGSESESGSLQFGSVNARADGGDGLAGTIAVTADGGGTIDLGAADLRASGASGGEILMSAGNCACGGDEGGEVFALSESPEGGGGISADSLFMITSGNIDLFVGGGADIAVAGSVQGFSGQIASLLSDDSGSAIRAHEFGLNAITISGGANIVADAVRLTASQNMSVGDIAAGDLIALNAGNDLSAGNLSAANSLQVAGHRQVTLGDLDSHAVNAVSLFGDLSAGDVHAATAVITAGGATHIGDLDASETAFVTANHDMVTGDVTATNSVKLFGAADIDTGDLKSSTVTIATGGDISVQDVDASADATFTAQGLASFGGIVSSPTITVTSADIDIADGASLGVSGVTNLITLNAVSHGDPIVLGAGGGESEGGQYVLDEDGDIESAAVVLNAKGANNNPAPDIQVFDAQIEGSATDGGGVGSVTLNTDGNVLVLGDVQFINAASTDKLTVDAGHSIQVDTDGGSIAMTDSAGDLAGTLALNADNVWVGSGTLLEQLNADPNFAGRADALGTNPGENHPDGFLRAGTISSQVVDSFLVQNSGTPDQFAGVDAGAGGLGITSTGSTPAIVIAYGRQTLGDGSTITNEDFLGSVDLSGTGGFTDDSAVNGCAIGGGGCHAPDFAFDSSSVLGGVSSDDNDKDDDADSDDTSDASAADPALKLINTTPVNIGHQIDDPVTSGGDVVIGGGPGGLN
jgi:filamentous hemagglutinin family protein